MLFFIDLRDSHEDTGMDVEEQEQKFRQSLDHLSHNTTQLTNTLVCNVTERLPQLYLKTKLPLLQQAWNELAFFCQKVGVPSTKEPAKPLFPQEEPKKKVSKRRKLSTAERRRATPSKRKKVLREPIPIKISVRLEEWMDKLTPLSFQ